MYMKYRLKSRSYMETMKVKKKKDPKVNWNLYV